LDLSNNKISRDSCGLLAEALKSSGLKELILVECEISDEGGEKIALQMRTNTKLHTLNLTQNRLNCKTGRAFVTSLHVNFTLTRLNLSLNAIPYDNMKEINSSIERNHYMKITNFKSSKPKVRVSLPDELIDEE
jgi:Ran GTPase-activating protein (RanGAP) involved in mRNA processing and transport